MARQVFQPIRVLGSTWLPFLTVYSGVVADLCSQPGGGACSSWASATVTRALPDNTANINATEDTFLMHHPQIGRAAGRQRGSETRAPRRLRGVAQLDQAIGRYAGRSFCGAASS